jgi:hypothetical protein
MKNLRHATLLLMINRRLKNTTLLRDMVNMYIARIACQPAGNG